jgi:hypothetical protein
MKLSAVVFGFLLPFLTLSASGQKTIEATPLENVSPELSSGVRREVFDAAKTPALAAVGRINFIGQSWCTIILVAEDVAVSAGHCFLKANVRFDLKKDLNPFFTAVIFKPDGKEKIENVHVERILSAKLNPDYAIVQLSKKIPAGVIKPLKISRATFDELRADEARLGCAAFNGDNELGSGGLLLTISRNIKIIPESSSLKRLDASCFSTYGGSGGLFYREKIDTATNVGEYDFLGVIWGMTDEKLNENGELVKADEIVTSITPVSAFYDELTSAIEKTKEKRNGKIGTENERE